jgi:hypothetical protein
MGEGSHQVVANRNGRWDVKRGGADRASAHFERTQDAVDKCREINKKQGTKFEIHDKHGKIKDSDSHGHDPYPPKG